MPFIEVVFRVLKILATQIYSSTNLQQYKFTAVQIYSNTNR